MLTVKPCGGICNRLRVIMSYYMYCEKNNIDLTIFMENLNECGGDLLECFIFPKKINFVSVAPKNIDVITCSTHKEFNNKPDIYDNLYIKDCVSEKINQYKNILGKYIAVHIRRTDHIELAKSKNRFTSDDEFIDFINKYPEHNVYIATDNYETQEKFCNLYKDRIKIIDMIDPDNKKTRKTTIFNAVIDLYMCINSEKFLGSGWSSFSYFIKTKKMKI